MDTIVKKIIHLADLIAKCRINKNNKKKNFNEF